MSSLRFDKQTRSEAAPFQDSKARSEVNLLKSSAVQKDGSRVPSTKIAQKKAANAKADFVNPYTNFLRLREQYTDEREYKQSMPAVAASIEIKGDDIRKNAAKQPAEVKKGSERPKITIKDMVVTPVLESRKVKAAVGDTLPGRGAGSRNDK